MERSGCDRTKTGANDMKHEVVVLGAVHLPELILVPSTMVQYR